MDNNIKQWLYENFIYNSYNKNYIFNYSLSFNELPNWIYLMYIYKGE